MRCCFGLYYSVGEQVVYAYECKDGAVELFRLGPVAKFAQLVFVSSLRKSGSVVVCGCSAWKKFVEVGVGESEVDFVQ